MRKTVYLFLVAHMLFNSLRSDNPCEISGRAFYCNQSPFLSIDNASDKNIATVLPNTPQHIVDKLYKMLHDLDRILRSAQLTYWIDGGTLLGAVRSKGLIQWDDDADICMFEEDIQRLKLLEPLLQQKGYRLSYTSVCYKISCLEDTPFPGKQWSFPFIDIFVMRRAENKIHYVFDMMLENCPRKPFFVLDSEVFDLCEYSFGPLKLWGPNQYLDYFKWWYGDWQNFAWRMFDHQSLTGRKKVVIRLTDELRKPALPSMTILDQLL